MIRTRGCAVCGKKITRKRFKSTPDRTVCSATCMNNLPKLSRDPTRKCVVCGEEITRKRFHSPPERTVCGPPKDCRRRFFAKLALNRIGPQNPNWHGGIRKTHGYVYVLRKGHPRTDMWGYVKRAILAVETKLGRPLMLGECVHHIDGNKENDCPSNLVAIGHGEHTALHARLRKLQGKEVT